MTDFIDFTCTICDDSRVVFSWTDTHGIAVCARCGAPYRLLFYDGDRQVLPPPPPELLLLRWYLPFARQFWQETHTPAPGTSFNFPGSSYELTTAKQREAFSAWYRAHLTEIRGAAVDIDAELDGRR